MSLETTQKLARVLHVLVLTTLVCNLLALYPVPTAVMQKNTLLYGAESYLDSFFRGSDSGLVPAAAAASGLAWYWVWQNAYTAVLTLFLLVAGCCTAAILWQGRQVLLAILEGAPFHEKNAGRLKRSAACCFLISAAALVRAVFSICFYRYHCRFRCTYPWCRGR